MPRLIGYLPPAIRGFVIELGGMVSLLTRTLTSAIRHPTGYWRAVLEEMHRTIRQAWLPVSVSIFGFLLAVGLVVAYFFSVVGAQQLFGPAMISYSTRSFTVWVDAIVVAGIIGAALTTDIGTRKVREELDAMAVMGIDPIRELAVPRIISVTLIMTMLSIPSLIVTELSLRAGATYAGHLTAGDFYHNLFDNLTAADVIGLVINNFVVGLIIGTVCCYKGFAAAGGAIGLGRAVNQAVVVTFLTVFVWFLAYQAVYLGLFPTAGRYR